MKQGHTGISRCDGA